MTRAIHKPAFAYVSVLAHTESLKQFFPRLRELAPGQDAGSRNLGNAFLSNSVFVIVEVVELKKTVCSCLQFIKSHGRGGIQNWINT